MAPRPGRHGIAGGASREARFESECRRRLGEGGPQSRARGDRALGRGDARIGNGRLRHAQGEGGRIGPHAKDERGRHLHAASRKAVEQGFREGSEAVGIESTCRFQQDRKREEEADLGLGAGQFTLQRRAPGGVRRRRSR